MAGGITSKNVNNGGGGQPKDRIYSLARNYMGEKGIIPVTKFGG